MCFLCGKFGHRDSKCPLKTVKELIDAEKMLGEEESIREASKNSSEVGKSSFGPWMVSQRARRRSMRTKKDNLGTLPVQSASVNHIKDQGESVRATNIKLDPTNVKLRGSRFTELEDQDTMDSYLQQQLKL